jgi:hypothetical protein
MRLTAFFLVAAACFPLTVRGAAVLEGELVEKLAEAWPDELIHVNIVMADRVDPEELLAAVDGFPKEAAREYVVNRLRAKAEETQAELRGYLDNAVAEGSAEDVRYIWLNNTVGLFAKPGLIEDLSLRDDIEKVNFDPPRGVLLESPGDGKDVSWSLLRIGADDAWDAGRRTLRNSRRRYRPE